MSAIVAYARVSTEDQTCENQRRTISARYAVGKWFTDDGVSGPIAATARPAMAALLAYVREGDVVVVAAIDRLGRNTLDVLNTVEALKTRTRKNASALKSTSVLTLIRLRKKMHTAKIAAEIQLGLTSKSLLLLTRKLLNVKFRSKSGIPSPN